MVSMAAYGMIGASLSNAVPIAQERASGWDPPAADHAAAGSCVDRDEADRRLSHGAAVAGARRVAAVLVNHVSLPAGTWLAIGLSLAVGVLPFAGIGLLFGFLFESHRRSRPS
jgi:hypothetical protein